MTRYPGPDAARNTAWQSWLLLLACLVIHYVVLHTFIRQNAYLDQRVLNTRKPFQVDLLAERPSEAKADRPEPTPAAVVTRPRPRPRPVVSAPPKPAERAAPPQAPSPSSAAASDGNAGEMSAAAQADAADASTSVGNDSQTVSAPGAASIQAGTDATGVAAAAAASADRAPSAEADKTVTSNANPPAGPLYGVSLPAPPPAGAWTYSVHIGEYHESGAAGSLKLKLEHDSTRYSIQAEVSATGLSAWFYGGTRRDVSQGRLTINGLEPMRYAEQRNRRAERSTTIDYGIRTITFAGGETSELPPGTQDRLSGLFQLGVLARARADLFQAGDFVEVSEINLRDVERVRYRVEGVETLEAPAGRFRTLHLRRQPASTGEPTLEVWLDYDAMMMPVRIRLTDRTGRIIDQVIDRKG